MGYILRQEYFAPGMTALVLWILILTSGDLARETERIFLYAAGVLLTVVFMDAGRGLAVGLPWLRHTLTVGIHSVRPVLAFMVLYAGYKRELGAGRWIRWLLAVNALVMLSSYFWRGVFYYDDRGSLVRKFWGFLPLATACVYLGIFLIFSLREIREGDRKKGWITLIIGMVTALVASIENMGNFLGVINMTAALSFTFYYMYDHVNKNNSDSLTGLPVRRVFYQDAARGKDVITAVLSLDLNDLKTLNDTYGHKEGDRALVTMARTVEAHMDKRCRFYRTGGDEFMMLCYRMGRADVEKMIGQLKVAMSETKYRFAIGYALYTPEKGLDQACMEADEAMYANKAHMKGGKARCMNRYCEQDEK